MSFKKFLTAGLLLAAAGPALAQGNAQTWRAAGTEPFWSVTLDGRTMRYEAPGQRGFTVNKPRPIVGFNGESYRTRRLSVDITHVPCSDGMSDRRYPDTVRVTVDRRTLKGCGGTPLPQAPRIANSSWTIESVSGIRGPAGNASIAFTGNRVSGSTGCNRFNGTWREERGRLILGPLATTKMACMGPGMNTERAVLDLLGQPLSIEQGRGRGSLVLAGRNGRLELREAHGGPSEPVRPRPPSRR